MAKFRERNPDVPVVESLDRRILQIVEARPSALDMSQWHTCETTHCRAGWAITLAGEAGQKLEEAHGSYQAGRMIYLASTGRAPHFFGSNESTLADLRRSGGNAMTSLLKCSGCGQPHVCHDLPPQRHTHVCGCGRLFLSTTPLDEGTIDACKDALYAAATLLEHAAILTAEEHRERRNRAEHYRQAAEVLEGLRT